MGAIYFYSWKKKYFEFSNFSLHPIVIDGKEYATNEHYFQSVKFLETEMTNISKEGEALPYREVVRLAKTPAEAKKLGSSRSFKIEPDWDNKRIDVMRKAVFAKFTQHESLKKLLLSTGDDLLIEDSPYDTFWGIGKNRNGQNMLGKLLMELRDKLRKSS